MTPPFRVILLPFVLASGTTGVGVKAIRDHFGVGETTTGCALRSLKQEGLIEPSHPRGGTSNRWGAPGTTAAWRARVEANYVRKKTNRDRQAIAAAIAARIEAEFESPPVKRIVDARQAPPLVVRGPASVWHYAQEQSA